MGSLHWLILIPYYFFTAVTAYLAFALICRAVRSRVSANPVAMAAVVTSLALTGIPLLAGWLTIANYNWRGLVGLLAVSACLATADALLKGSLPLPLDAELEDV